MSTLVPSKWDLLWLYHAALWESIYKYIFKILDSSGLWKSPPALFQDIFFSLVHAPKDQPFCGPFWQFFFIRFLIKIPTCAFQMSLAIFEFGTILIRFLTKNFCLLKKIIFHISRTVSEFRLKANIFEAELLLASLEFQV